MVPGGICSAAAPSLGPPPSCLPPLPSVTGILYGGGRGGGEGEEKFPTIIINFVIITMKEYL